jgi:magnesium chelatase subunit I
MVNELGKIQDLLHFTEKLGLGSNESDALRASAAEFILEGLYAHKRISRNEEMEFVVADRAMRNEERGRGDEPEFRRGGFEGRKGGPGGGGRRNLN